MSYRQVARKMAYCAAAKKSIYETELAARIGMTLAYEGNKRLRGELLHVYACGDHWHIGHVSARYQLDPMSLPVMTKHEELKKVK